MTSTVDRTDTQSTLFKTHNVERVVEIGPANTLATMAKRTLADPSYTDWDTAMSINRKILSCKSDHDQIYHVGANDIPITLPKTGPAVHTELAPSPHPPSTNTEPEAASSGQVIEQQETILTAEILTDEPITASQVLRFIVAYKLKRLPSELSESSTIKALVQGK